MSLISQVERIGPEKAMQYLQKNKLNRPLRQKWVMHLARQMKDNNWRLTGESIVLGNDGDLLDGQHRLNAVILSETQQEFLVVRNAANETFAVMDTGHKRSPADALFIANFPNPGVYARLGKACLRWNRGIFFGTTSAAMNPNNDEIVDYVTRHRKECAETINEYNQFKPRIKKLIQGHVLMFCYHKFREINDADAFLFVTRMLDGRFGDDERLQPIQVLRERLLTNMTNIAKLSPKQLFLMMFAAWNAFRTRKTVTNYNIPDSLLIKQRGKVVLE